jgi:type IV pilus assembly protein PilY1
MSGDPGYTTGSTTKFACRASYTILTTDGFWNGSDPSGIGTAAATDGPVQTVPAGAVAQYTAAAPYSGGGASGGVPSLADVATYYWENDLSDMANEVAPSAADPASWQHMTTFTVGLGYQPVGITPATATMSQIFAWARGGTAITGFGWPTPASGSLYNIADLAHAAVNGHGDFFNANNPQQLAAAFANAIADIGSRNVLPTPAGVNSSVLSIGALTFSTGYSTGDWSGSFEAVALNTDGSVGSALWKAGPLLDASYHSAGYTARKVYTGAFTVSGTGGTYSGFQLTAANQALLDSTETAGLQTPALAGGDDTLDNRINYLLGDNTYEGTSSGTTYRSRTSILGAILRSDPVYISGASGNYPSNWTQIGSAVPPESSSTAESYSTFVVDQSTREGTVYVGANDGMLHAFHAPVPKCTGTIDSNGNCSAYTSPVGSGTEAWAFVPRAVYANLGNLTDAANFRFLPTVDATPVTRDVFSIGDKKWHTLLTGGVGTGGRGVYALDVTSPSTFSASNVLWEFDADLPVDAGCVATYESCRGTDLGYTLSQPNIGRLANGEWVVLVPNGYFPDCTTPDTPTNDTTKCQAIAAQAPKDASGTPYSALFVLDAITGKMVAELKTPTNITGVTSFGLSTPVLGDYNGDRIDDVAFAGDVQGNLWRFDLSDPNPSNWNVTLVYQGTSSDGHQGVQPITTMPRLFPDPATNRFIVVFGTGKYLGFGDNSNTSQQAIYGVRDVTGTTYTQTNLTQQFLHEWVVPAGEPNEGTTLRCVTGSASDSCTSTATPINALPATGGGWYINLVTTDSDGVLTDSGERVVVTPSAIFASNSVVFQSLITGALNSDPCSPSTQGALMVLSAASGGPGSVSTLGPWPTAGGRITNARTHGSLPAVSTMGGGQILYPSGQLSDGTPIGPDTSISRRRSWRVLLNDQ